MCTICTPRCFTSWASSTRASRTASKAATSGSPTSPGRLSRGCWRRWRGGLAAVCGWHGLRGMGPAPARKLGGGSAFALRARGEIDRFQRGLRTHPAAASELSTWTPREGTRCRVWSVCMGSAGRVLRPQGNSGENRLSRCARGERLIASNAGYGPIPLPLWGCRHGFSLTPRCRPNARCRRLKEALA